MQEKTLYSVIPTCIYSQATMEVKGILILYLAHSEIVKVQAGMLNKLLGLLFSFPSYVLPILPVIFIPLLTVKL